MTLDGTKSSDADGDALTYLWTLTSKPAGSTATLIGSTSSQPTFVADVTGDYVATLVVNDGKLDSAPATVAITAGTEVGFDSLTPLPLNMPSVGPEAYAFNNIGDQVVLETSSPHTLNSVNIAMSSWACQTGTWNAKNCASAAGATFPLPVTIDIYDSSTTFVQDPNTHKYLPSGSPVATETKTIDMPYRPSADSACTGADAGKWKGSDGVCYNGFGFQITFDLSSQKVTLPDDKLSYLVSYNTDHYGPNPIGGTNSPSDSLNVGLATTAPSIGTYAPGAHLIWNGTNQDMTGYGIMAQFQMMAP